MYYHRVWADIDLDALSFNLSRMKERLPEGASVMVVVKADGYGHGAVHVARHLEQQGIWGFGVGDSAEALELRKAGINAPILILGAIIADEIEKVVKNGISVCIHSGQRAELLNREALRQGKRCRVHLMVDTGMGRLGVFPEQATGLARMIQDYPGLILEGAATHYSCTADRTDGFTGVQTRRFLDLKGVLIREGIQPSCFHASNSGALIAHPPESFNLVRTGIALYGVSAAREPELDPPLKPVLSLKAQIIYMKDVPEETPIGYDRLYVTPKPTRIATVPIGYNDGFPYRLSNRGRMLLHGCSAPVVGAVSMDYTMIDVGHIQGAAVGDRVTLVGADGDERITVEELARTAGTIPYEITCGIGKRVRRIALAGSGEESRGSKEPSRQEREGTAGSRVEIG